MDIRVFNPTQNKKKKSFESKNKPVYNSEKKTSIPNSKKKPCDLKKKHFGFKKKPCDLKKKPCDLKKLTEIFSNYSNTISPIFPPISPEIVLKDLHKSLKPVFVFNLIKELWPFQCLLLLDNPMKAEHIWARSFCMTLSKIGLKKVYENGVSSSIYDFIFSKNKQLFLKIYKEEKERQRKIQEKTIEIRKKTGQKYFTIQDRKREKRRAAKARKKAKKRLQKLENSANVFSQNKTNQL